MTDGEDNSFLLVGMDEENKEKEQISIINRDSSTLSNLDNKTKEVEIIKENKGKEETCFDKFIKRMLSLDKAGKNKNNKRNKKYIEEDFFMFDFELLPKTIVKSSRHPSNDSSNINFDINLFNQKKESIVKGIIELKKENEWNEFIQEYRKEKIEKNKIKILLKETFNVNSDFILIWKFLFSLFYMFVFFFVFLYFIFFDLIKLEENENPQKRILYFYHIINFMFLVDLILSLFILIINGGSKFSYLKIPIKIYLVIPFPLKKKFIIFLLPKFCRVDLFRRVFSNIEQFIVKHITPFIQNYRLKIFVLYINRLFAYLLEFGLYAHFACCLYSYLDNVSYIHGIYYTIEIITTMGYGEQSPKNEYSMGLVMITIFIGANFVMLTNCNINFITTKIRSFSRITSPKKRFESFIFLIQSSTGKFFPTELKDSIYTFIKFYESLSYNAIKSEYFQIYSLFRPRLKENILNSSLNYLKLEYKLFFKGCEDDFINSLFEKLKPKIYKENKVIINIGQRVDKLYFLLNGTLLAFNENNENIFTINNASIFNEYEFITGLKSKITIKAHPNIISYGFVIHKKDWNIISKKFIYSSKKFINLCLNRREKIMKKLNERYNNIKRIKINRENKSDNFKNIVNEIFILQRKVINLEQKFIKFKANLFDNLKCK